ncbi:unnamed protein product [Ectocarpus sp. 13 AM-2016]
MALLPSTPSTPPLITNHSSHRQSSLNPINAIHPCLAKAAVKTTTTTTKPPSLHPRYQPIAFHRWILSAGCFYCCFYPAARARSRLICERWLIGRLARASPGRPRAAIPLSTHRLQHQPLL